MGRHRRSIAAAYPLHPSPFFTNPMTPPTQKLVRDLMVVGVGTCTPDTPFLMHHAVGIEYPATQLSNRHLLRYLAAAGDEELSDLGIHAACRLPLDPIIERRDAAHRLAARRKA